MRVKAWNDIEVWVTAGSKRLAEEDIDLDEADRRYKTYLFAPHGIDLAIHIRSGARKPCTSDFIIEVSFDGRVIHAIPMKRCDHSETVVDGWFVLDDDTDAKLPFTLGSVPRFDDTMLPKCIPSEDALGLIQIDLYKATLRKKPTRYRYTQMPLLKAHKADDLQSDHCTIPGRPRPCIAAQMKAPYMHVGEYKGPTKTAWVSCVYVLKERPDDGQEWDSKLAVRRQMDRPEMTVVKQLADRVGAMETMLKKTIGKRGTHDRPFECSEEEGGSEDSGPDGGRRGDVPRRGSPLMIYGQPSADRSALQVKIESGPSP